MCCILIFWFSLGGFCSFIRFNWAGFVMGYFIFVEFEGVGALWLSVFYQPCKELICYVAILVFLKFICLF